MFQNTYGISRGKVDFMIFKKRSSATGISSTTGKGAHKPHNFNIDIRTRMLNHIKSFPLQESHYARKRTSHLYLSSSLNISKMYDLYKDHCLQNGFNDESSYWLYRTVFSKTFKIKLKHVFDEELQILNQKNQDHINMVELAYNSKKEDKLWTYNETIRDLGKNESYYYMWHEALARRGSIEVASILYKFIQGKIDNNITHLITYSDTCSCQNRHTHLECDSDHSRIERCKKQSESTISIPNDWYNFVRNVRGKIPLKVIEMEQIDFKSFSSLLSGPLVKRALDTDKEKINWLKMTWIRYDKTFGFIQFKYTLNKEAPFRILDLRKGAMRTRNRAEFTSGLSNIRLPLTYNGPLSIDSEKKKDLISLLPLLDLIYHQFYKDLKTNTRAVMIQQSDEE
ncbi:hypothetical protein AGLY_003321 [Aphis glycines]|uniref:Uncharacterized protein n=1 Tax=Aphis glycines TaxID=307491 RepID=A0A6G0U100_APHGL|nr:hypothetical protein AGLY_003321 [Aphis glycines]